MFKTLIYSKIKLKDGVLHCDDGPAVLTSNHVFHHYYKYGKRHREDGPAIFSFDKNYEEWYLNGELHNSNGPALIFKDSIIEWYLYDIFINKEIWYWMDENNIKFPLSDCDLILFTLRWK